MRRSGQGRLSALAWPACLRCRATSTGGRSRRWPGVRSRRCCGFSTTSASLWRGSAPAWTTTHYVGHRPPTSMTLAGLRKHLARVEDNGFSDVVVRASRSKSARSQIGVASTIARVAMWEPMPTDHRDWVLDAAAEIKGFAPFYLRDPPPGMACHHSLDDDSDLAALGVGMAERAPGSAGTTSRIRGSRRRPPTRFRAVGHDGHLQGAGSWSRSRRLCRRRRGTRSAAKPTGVQYGSAQRRLLAGPHHRLRTGGRG